MAQKTGKIRSMVVNEFFRRATLAWKRYQEAKGDLQAQREAYEALIKILRPLYDKGFKEEIIHFLKKTGGMPTRAVLKRLAE